MSSAIRSEVDSDGIGLITWSDPARPMNVLNDAALGAFDEHLRKLLADPACKGIVITSGRKEFIVGADIGMLVKMRELPPAEILAGIQKISFAFRAMEKQKKPIVAAINGDALGGGLEVALACHYRIVADAPNIKLGLPEVQLGLLPGAGGTQRVPRLIGAEEALKFITLGKPVDPAKALQLGLVNEVVPADQLIARAKTVIREGKVTPEQPWDRPGYKVPGARPGGDAWAQIFVAGTAMLRAQTYDNYPAPRAIMACVYHGLQLSIDSGLKFESRKFLSLITSPVSRGMIRTMWYGRNRANKLDKRPRGVPKTEFKKVGILGAGLMGSGIAIVTAEAGIPCVLLDVAKEQAEKGKANAADYWQRQVEKRRLTPEKRAKLLELIQATTDYSELAGSQLVIEAVFENRQVKAEVTAAAEAKAGEAAVFGSNTSTLPITGLAEASKRPESFIGIHFFSPVEQMPLVEIIRGKQTGDRATAVAMDYVRAIRKTPIVVNDSRGFYTSRVFGTYTREGIELLREGIDPVVIEHAGKATGMPMGPLEVTDMVGIDTAHKISKATLKEVGADALKAKGDNPENLEIYSWLVEKENRPGQKAGKGFYEYEGRKPARIWSGVYERFPKGKKEATPEELRRRLLHIQALETIRCLEEGVVTAPDDADVGSVLGWGFAPWSGGVLSYVDAIGIPKFLAECEELEAKYGRRFKPPQLLRTMAEKGQKFYPVEPTDAG
jgi:3-hydroxyacyl-CoA dehydrogenase / enoyl-CoA hydratase / 3-hydroxybutyryl-CoA epimerase